MAPSYMIYYTIMDFLLSKYYTIYTDRQKKRYKI